MKKSIILALALSFILSATACGNASKKAETANAKTSETTTTVSETSASETTTPVATTVATTTAQTTTVASTTAVTTTKTVQPPKPSSQVTSIPKPVSPPPTTSKQNNSPKTSTDDIVLTLEPKWVKDSTSDSVVSFYTNEGYKTGPSDDFCLLCVYADSYLYSYTSFNDYVGQFSKAMQFPAANSTVYKKINGISACVQDIDRDYNGATLKTKVYYFNKNNGIYVLIFSYPVYSDTTISPQIDQIVNSLKIK